MQIDGHAGAPATAEVHTAWDLLACFQAERAGGRPMACANLGKFSGKHPFKTARAGSKEIERRGGGHKAVGCMQRRHCTRRPALLSLTAKCRRRYAVLGRLAIVDK